MVCPAALKPNQRIAVALAGADRPSSTARVAWTSFEMYASRRGSRYRAGIDFVDADPSAVERVPRAIRPEAAYAMSPVSVANSGVDLRRAESGPASG